MSCKDIMDERGMNRALQRLAHELIERNKGTDDVVLCGILRRGMPLALRIAALVEQYEGVRLPVGSLDIAYYRDDLSLLSEHPEIQGSDMPFSVAGKRVILVDDVLYTGRTARAAIEGIFRLGRAQSIQLMVMVDRGHRELPIHADYIGKNLPTSHREVVKVRVSEIDGSDSVVILSPEDTKEEQSCH